MKKILFSAFKEDKYLNRCEIEIQYIAGSYFDPKGKEGQAHLMEHLLITPKISAELSNFGVSSNAFTNNEMVTFTFSGPYTDEFDYGVKRAYSRIDNILKGEIGRFTQEDLDKERAIVKDEIKRSEADFDTVTFQEFKKRVYSKDNPYYFEGISRTLGTEESIDKLTPEDVKQFFEKNIKGRAPLIKVYFEGTKQNYKKLLKDIKDIIKSNKFTKTTNKFPFEEIDRFVDGPVNEEIKTQKGEGSYFRVIKAYIAEHTDYDPIDNILQLTWSGRIRTLAYEASRETGIAYQISTHAWDFDKKRIYFIYYSIKNADADNKIKQFEDKLDEKIAEFIKTKLKERIDNYKISTQLYPLLPHTILNDESYQFRRFGKIDHSLHELVEKSKGVTEDQLEEGLRKVLSSKVFKVKILW